MPKRPLFPGRALLGWLAINAHFIVVGALFGAFHSSVSKLGIAAFDAGGIVFIMALFVGRLFEWNRVKSHLRAGQHSARADNREASGGAAHRRAA